MKSQTQYAVNLCLATLLMLPSSSIAQQFPEPEEVFRESNRRAASPVSIEAAAWIVNAYKRNIPLTVPRTTGMNFSPYPRLLVQIDGEFGVPVHGLSDAIPPGQFQVTGAGIEAMQWFARRGIYPVNSFKSQMLTSIPDFHWADLNKPNDDGWTLSELPEKPERPPRDVEERIAHQSWSDLKGIVEPERVDELFEFKKRIGLHPRNLLLSKISNRQEWNCSSLVLHALASPAQWAYEAKSKTLWLRGYCQERLLTFQIEPQSGVTLQMFGNPKERSAIGGI